MATKHDVIRLHREHPNWTPTDIANALGCLSAYVRATAKRYGLTLPKGGPPPDPDGSMYALGAKCKRLGITLADLDRFSEHTP